MWIGATKCIGCVKADDFAANAIADAQMMVWGWIMLVYATDGLLLTDGVVGLDRETNGMKG